MASTEKKKQNVFVSILEWILIAFGAFIVFCNVWNIVDQNTGYHNPLFNTRWTTIISESMASKHPDNEEELDNYDRIQKNDVVISTSSFTWESLNKYDVILFKDAEHGLVCHRLLAKQENDGIRTVITRGDANNVIDKTVDFKDVIGKVTGVVPKVGVLIDFIKSPYFILGVCGAVAIVIVGILIADGAKESKEKKLATANNAPVKEKPEDKICPVCGKPMSEHHHQHSAPQQHASSPQRNTNSVKKPIQRPQQGVQQKPNTQSSNSGMHPVKKAQAPSTENKKR